MENVASHFTGPGGFSYSIEKYVPSDKGFHSERSFSRKTIDVSDLNARLNHLERRARGRAEISVEEAIQAKKEYIQLREEKDNQFCEDMEALAGDDYEAKKAVYQRLRDQGLSPSQAKAKYRQEQEDDAWVEEMLAYGGQED